MTVVVWGLKQCDTCRRATRWLDAQGIDYAFRDIRAETPDAAEFARWVAAAGLDRLVNRRSTTWRGLDEGVRDALDADTAPAILAAHPTLVKRPVLLAANQVLIGFREEDWARALDV